MKPRITFHPTRADFDPIVPYLAPLERHTFAVESQQHHSLKCLPLSMANRMGLVIPSPFTFKARWDGDSRKPAEIIMADERLAQRQVVTAHAAAGTFTIQPGWIPRTDRVGDFVVILPLLNEPRAYACMGAAIEAWWNPGAFGLVFQFTRPGIVSIGRGEPVAQMICLPAEYGAPEVAMSPLPVPQQKEWQDLKAAGKMITHDYTTGRLPNGEAAAGHLTKWR